MKFPDRIQGFKFDKGWMWLLYLDFILPLLLFVVAYMLNKLGTGFFLSRIFHTYNLFIASPSPNFSSFTGIPGLAINAGVLINAIRKKDWKDAVLCLIIALLAALYFIFELNYKLSFLLKFNSF